VVSERARIAAFWPPIHARLATRTEPFPGGVAYLDKDFALRMESNFLHVTEGAEAASAEALDAAADRILGAAGMGHREVVVDDDDRGARLAAGFAALGYEAVQLAVFAWRGGASRSSAPALVEEVSLDEVLPFVAEVDRRAPYDADEATVALLARYRRKLAALVDTRFVAARASGGLASACTIRAERGVAQIDDVVTLAEHRGRGLGSAVVLRAVESARAGGCDVIFLYADRAGPARGWYRALGFEEIGGLWSFVRWLGVDP
jgi:ribosomal protein S18 acetylase RimI-like enzyme